MSNSRTSLVTNTLKCSCKGYNLDKLLQPVLLTLLAVRDLHGYMIIQELIKKDLFQGENIDSTGIYRTLKTLEDKGLVSSKWDTESLGTAKKIYTINSEGRICLNNWIKTLENYKGTIETIIEDAQSTINK